MNIFENAKEIWKRTLARRYYGLAVVYCYGLAVVYWYLMYSTCTVQLEVLAAWSYTFTVRKPGTISAPYRDAHAYARRWFCLNRSSSRAVFRFRSPARPGPRPGCPRRRTQAPLLPAQARPADRRWNQLPGAVRATCTGRGRWLTRRGPGLRFFTGKQCTDALF